MINYTISVNSGNGFVKIPVKGYYSIPVVKSDTLQVITKLFVHKVYGGMWGLSDSVSGCTLGNYNTRKEAREEGEKLADMYYKTGKPEFETAIKAAIKYQEVNNA